MYLDFLPLIQADILWKLILELDQSIRSTCGYPGRQICWILFFPLITQKLIKSTSLSEHVKALYRR
ncbi:hypothetical protein F0562_007660 [Nyssa sinensis]|uniref:Uncharacterized protein n=1 Tax=Nyssa sinensis TaxID=561372 RepID=A0A5J5A3Z2_9ASTE|nr:hypothetical protein F0562_007660 [Nyssa sinensis]